MIVRLIPNYLISFIFFCLLFFVLGATPVYATDNLKPVHREDAFKGLQLDIEKQNKLQKELSAQKKKEEKDLRGLKESIVPVANEIRLSEQKLLEIEDKITNNLLEQSKLKETLKKNQKILSDSLMAGLRLKRVPSETLFLQAATPLQTAQTAMILERTAPQIKKRMSFLSESYQELANLQKDLDFQKEEQQKELASLLVKQEEIEALITKRQDHIDKTQKNIKQAEVRAGKLSREAKNLKDLMEKVRAKNEAARQAQKEEQQLQQREVVSSGDHNWPVAGSVKVAYGAKDVYGAKTQGIKIQTRAGALVTTPMNGTVMFAGPFKRHGKIVIIEHSGGWHSLMSGMERLDVIAGQSVKNGEPVGRMTSQNTAEGLLLYYELRYKGNPTNPSRKIKGLS